MEGEDQGADKPYDPTPRKLEDARKKGEIVRSADLNTAVVYAGFLLSGSLLAAWIIEGLGTFTIAALADADRLSQRILSPGGTGVAFGATREAVVSASAVILAPAALLLVALFAQRGFLFTPSKVAPKLNRIAPLANARNKYGASGMFQFVKSAVKLAVVSFLLAIFLWRQAETILASIYASPGQILSLFGQITFDFLIVATAIMAAIGGVDWIWEWAQLRKRNRMSHQELTDETKSSEGDPYMKQARRQKGQALAMNQMIADVPKADVVIVNPTHYAVALKWERRGGKVPICVAKGVDEVAHTIRRTAAEAGVPIYSDPPTSRALYALVAVGDPIQTEHYRAVAAAIRFADLIRQKARKR